MSPTAADPGGVSEYEAVIPPPPPPAVALIVIPPFVSDVILTLSPALMIIDPVTPLTEATSPPPEAVELIVIPPFV